ncbi:hypothetical protein [Burkholderia sp. HI2500]|uniref:hypothetical protein n=1 Tax=Burkholderia sp. HI2500 TaxID=2015358 RepID=UPI000B7AEDEF|nr:hypothetical protein [Burkholderia sp. HI2500]OXJ06658.1 hypothetical protein CFB45_37570 [Burkholderia sp. HI2500]
MTPTLAENLIFIVAASIGATWLYRKVVPYLWSRKKGESAVEHLERVRIEQQEKQSVQQNLNMTPKMALRVRLVNFGILLGFLCFLAFIGPRAGHPFMQHVTLYFGAYVIVGWVACALAKVVAAERLDGLNWDGRLNVRLYHVWLWPLNVVKAIRGKS